MIKLKILAVLVSITLAVTEDLKSFFFESDDQLAPNELLTDIKPIESKKSQIITPPIITNYKVSASVYFPEPSQTDSTPLITADGSKINKKNPKKQRWIAVSRDLHTRWGGDLDFGDSLMVTGVSENLDGVYIVKDIMNRRMKKKIDILVSRKDKIYGLWHDVQLAKLD
jgi:3D (Asp-Asp-Asp) domain-containing protein